MEKINKWAAEQSGVIIGKQMYTLPNGKRYLYPFTLKDARCREIVREHFRITTDPIGDEWHSWLKKKYSPYPELTGIHTIGKTIPEAEMVCINAIYGEYHIQEIIHLEDGVKDDKQEDGLK